MPYFAAALARRGSRWTGEEIDLTEVEDLDGVADVLRASAGDDADVALLLFEQEDEWFAVVRLDDDADPRVFVSDARVVESSAIGGILGEAAVDEDLDNEDEDEDADEDDEEEDAVGPAGEPVGDHDLLSDLGTPGGRLLALCAEEGQLPGDILSVVCESAGCLDVFEQLREG